MPSYYTPTASFYLHIHTCMHSYTHVHTHIIIYNKHTHLHTGTNSILFTCYDNTQCLHTFNSAYHFKLMLWKIYIHALFLWQYACIAMITIVYNSGILYSVCKHMHVIITLCISILHVHDNCTVMHMHYSIDNNMHAYYEMHNVWLSW